LLGKWFWNTYAFCYDALTWLVPYQRMMTDVTGALALRPGMRVLDVGCGTGNLEVAIRLTGIPVEVEALDFSDAMLQRARRKNPSERIVFRQVDLTDGLPHPAGRFDAVVCNNVFYALPNQPYLLTEMQRVLKPGGHLILSDPCPTFRWGAIFRAHLVPTGLRGSGTWLLHGVRTLLASPPLALVALANLLIEANGQRRGGYHYHTPDDIAARLGTPIRQHTYAGQNWLIIWERTDTHVQVSSDHEPC
jgi:SAM-dependent methyltransferase